jgi:hypothetical protein
VMPKPCPPYSCGAGLGERPVELGRELVRLVFLHPVLVAEVRGELADRLADRVLVLAELEVHGFPFAAFGPMYQRTDQTRRFT